MGDDLTVPDGATADGDRLDQEAESDSDFVDDLADMIGAVQTGDKRNSITVRDQHTAALFHTLAEHPEQLQDTLDAVRERVDAESKGEGNRTELFTRLLRAGIRDVAPELADAEMEARRKRLERDY